MPDGTASRRAPSPPPLWVPNQGPENPSLSPGLRVLPFDERAKPPRLRQS
jgi:hypothetical protein